MGGENSPPATQYFLYSPDAATSQTAVRLAKAWKFFGLLQHVFFNHTRQLYHSMDKLLYAIVVVDGRSQVRMALLASGRMKLIKLGDELM